jgi:hypothetical protein
VRRLCFFALVTLPGTLSSSPSQVRTTLVAVEGSTPVVRRCASHALVNDVQSKIVMTDCDDENNKNDPNSSSLWRKRTPPPSPSSYSPGLSESSSDSLPSSGRQWSSCCWQCLFRGGIRTVTTAGGSDTFGHHFDPRA